MKFKVGDLVIVISTHHPENTGAIGEVVRYELDAFPCCVRFDREMLFNWSDSQRLGRGREVWFRETSLRLIQGLPAPSTDVLAEELLQELLEVLDAESLEI